jgi:uncharacterized protein (DUF2147 family)
MKKAILFSVIYVLSFASTLVGDDVIGFWKTIDDETHKPQSIVGIYKNHNKFYGRIVATYDEAGQSIKETLDSPKERAPGVEGHPYYVGMDIIWDLHHDGEKFTKGKILDPEKGRVYDAEMWTKDGNLIVRGELFLFGKNETWLSASASDFPAGFKMPDLSALVPKIPHVK